MKKRTKKTGKSKSPSRSKAVKQRKPARKTKPATRRTRKSTGSMFLAPAPPQPMAAPAADPAHADGHKKLHHRWRPSAEDHTRDKAMNAKQRFSPADKVRVNRSMQRRILTFRSSR